MKKSCFRYLAVSLALLAAPSLAQEATPAAESAPGPVPPLTATSSVTITLESAGDIERKVVAYLCDDGTALSVQYLNAAPNFLAIVPVEGKNHVFATTISASGARYVSGPYEWWSDGDEATLRDLMQDEDAAPLATCSAAGNTP